MPMVRGQAKNHLGRSTIDINPSLLSPCGLYCGTCAIYYATRDDTPKFKERLVHVYEGKIPGAENLSADDIHCHGCLSDDQFLACRDGCPIKICVQSKGYTGCHQCDDFPCQFIDNFPLPVGKKAILRAVPYRKEWGTERWVVEEEARYHCPQCGHKLFRGAKRCNRCSILVDLD